MGQQSINQLYICILPLFIIIMYSLFICGDMGVCGVGYVVNGCSKVKNVLRNVFLFMKQKIKDNSTKG